MINAVIYNKDGKTYGFRISGHADYSPRRGGVLDIVCSAVSMLVINTVNSIEKLTDADADVKTNEEKGLIELRLNNPPDDAVLLINSLILGLRSVEEEYSDYIKVSEE